MELDQLQQVLKRGEKLKTVFKLSVQPLDQGQVEVIFANFEQFGTENKINPRSQKLEKDSWRMGFNSFRWIDRNTIISLEIIPQQKIRSLFRILKSILDCDLDQRDDATLMYLVSMLNTFARRSKKRQQK
jgi:hypothetical protein